MQIMQKVWPSQVKQQQQRGLRWSNNEADGGWRVRHNGCWPVYSLAGTVLSGGV